MAPFDSAPRPSDPAGKDGESTPRTPKAPQTPVSPVKDGGRPSRPIPTPGDLWPRGVRPGVGEDSELATGTG